MLRLEILLPRWLTYITGKLGAHLRLRTKVLIPLRGLFGFSYNVVIRLKRKHPK